MKNILIVAFFVTFAMLGYSQSENRYATIKSQVDSLVMAYNVTMIEVYYGNTMMVYVSSDYKLSKGFLVVNTPDKRLFFFNLDRLVDFRVEKNGKNFIMHYDFN